MNRLAVCLVIISLSSACATQYQPKGATGGFTETRLSPEEYWGSFYGDRRIRESYSVSFFGNRNTSMSRATDFTLLRCAELTLQNEFTHFVVTTERQWAERDTNWYDAENGFPSDGVGGQRPRSTKTFYMLNTTDGINADVYDATFIVKSLKTKYSIE